MLQPTIFALSSGAPPAGIAVVRISGDQAGTALHTLTARALPEPRTAVLRVLQHPRTAEMLDHAVVIWLPGPDTVTGDDIAEVHLHGGRAVVAVVLEALTEIDGLVMAQAGAFTRRAFENGRMDLSQVEGLADLLAAETAAQRRSALAMAEGQLGSLASAWRQEVLQISARVEALLDYADEDGVPHTLDRSPLAELSTAMQQWCGAPSAERLRDGIRVVLAGPPNAGKSTLLNVLAGRDAAIISPVAGTTRDIIEAPVILDGIPFVMTDTAGLHATSADVIEQEGIRRARRALERADIILWLGAPVDCPDKERSILLAARADELAYDALGVDQLAISAKTGLGMATLRKQLLQKARALLPVPDSFAINERQRRLIAACAIEVDAAHLSDDLLLTAEHLRGARAQLDQLVGRAGVEDMLDVLFSGFCIGK